MCVCGRTKRQSGSNYVRSRQRLRGVTGVGMGAGYAYLEPDK